MNLQSYQCYSVSKKKLENTLFSIFWSDAPLSIRGRPELIALRVLHWWSVAALEIACIWGIPRWHYTSKRMKPLWVIDKSMGSNSCNSSYNQPITVTCMDILKGKMYSGRNQPSYGPPVSSHWRSSPVGKQNKTKLTPAKEMHLKIESVNHFNTFYICCEI